MNMKLFKSFFAVFFIILSLTVTAQKKLSKEAKKEINILGPQGDFLLGEGNYYRAVVEYLKVLSLDSTQEYYQYQIGISYLYTDEKEKALKYLSKVYTSDPQATDILFNMGRAYHVNYQFDTAISYFNRYLATNPTEDKKTSAKNYIDYCNNAKVLISHKIRGKIINLGGTINSPASEYAPVITGDESEIIFTYRGPLSTGGLENIKFQPDSNGEYYEDMFITKKAGLDWTIPEKVPGFDTKGNNASIALSNDGHELFTFSSTPKDGGDIYVSKLDSNNSWSKPENLGPNINTPYWEGSCSLSSDGRTLYFASERPGGFGGRDIYYSRIQQDGKWGPAHNLGANINTPLNDDAPFIHPDGVTLFFSSEGWGSMGGYDVFYSTINLEDSTWNRPVNMGYPINSPDDDRYYVLSADGSRGYFSSNRKGGNGQEDLYLVTPGYHGSRPILALTVGVVYVDGNPVVANINVVDMKKNEDRGTFHSNAFTGKYIVALTPGTKYKITVNAPGAESRTEYVDIDSLATFVRVKEDFHLFTPEYKKAHNMEMSDTSNVIQTRVTQQQEAFLAEGDNTYEDTVYQRVLDAYGTTDSSGVTYNVELGTYQDPKDFDSTKYKGIGKIMTKVDNQGNTTFYVDSLHTLVDAEIVKYKVIAKDSNMKHHIKVMVADHGKNEMMQQFYIKQYQEDRPDYQPDTNRKIVMSSNHVAVITNVVKAPPIVKEEKKAVAVKEVNNTKPAVQEAAESPCNPGPPQNFAPLVGKDLNDPVVYKQLLEMAGTICKDSLIYHVQIGAYRHPENYKYRNLSSLIPPYPVTLPPTDGITRFNLRSFKTLKKAEAFRQHVIGKGTRDAWITAEYKGKRMLLQELITANFFTQLIN
jgi:hypothetical protein